MGVKRDSTDAIFSDVIRAAANCCQAHGIPVLNGGEWIKECEGNLECCHIKSRSYHSIRHTPENALSMCSRHHHWFTANPASFGNFVEEMHPGREDLLNELIRERKGFKYLKNMKTEMRAHYRQELKRIIKERNSGVTGPIPVVGFI